MQGRVAVVTGGAMGIGRHIARTFVEAGARVAIGDIAREELRRTESELAAAGAEVFGEHLDVRDEASVRAFMAAVHGRFGRIDALVNDAGIVPHFAWGTTPRWPVVRDMDLGFWERVIGTNLGGTFLCCKHVIPHMERQGSGHIVNLWGGGQPTPPGACAYVVTKDAIRTFTRFLAEEVRPAGICATVLSPGGTIATENAPEEARRRLPGPDLAANRFVLAAQAEMSLSGHLLDLRDGHLVVAD